jgi:superfamily II DNA or RNA helicase
MTSLSKVKLTDEQEEVKRVILGKSCVVNACPGAGKTTLSLVVAKDFKKKTLILTFSV